MVITFKKIGSGRFSDWYMLSAKQKVSIILKAIVSEKPNCFCKKSNGKSTLKKVDFRLLVPRHIVELELVRDLAGQIRIVGLGKV